MWMLLATAWAAELDLELVAADFDLSAETDRSVRRILSRMVSVYSGWLGLALPPTLPVKVTVVQSEARYRQLERETLGRQGHTLGFFSPARGEAWVWGGQGDEGMKDTLVHETAHWLLALAGAAGAPRWVHEGLAEAFERARVDGNAVWLDPDPQVLAWMRTQRVPPAAQLVGLSSAGWASVPAGVFQQAEYPYGWALVSFLLSSEQGRRVLGDIVVRTASGDPTAAVAALDEGWPGGAAGFDGDWRAWWSGSPGRIQLPIATSGGQADGWKRCADGSLIRVDAGLKCGRWVAGEHGVMRFVEDP